MTAGLENAKNLYLEGIRDGQVVEHWDNTEPVPPQEEWANSGKF
jgi:hypothetical protein